MRKHQLQILILNMFLFSLFLSSCFGGNGGGSELAGSPISTAAVPDDARRLLVESFGKLPLSFEPNQGQTDRRVKFFSRGEGYTLFLTGSEAVLSLGQPRSRGSADEAMRTRLSADALSGNRKWELASPYRQSDVLRVRFVGSNRAPRVVGLDELPGKSNYFIGSDPQKWRTNVATYAKVKYQNVYPGVDLIYYGNQRQLEHDFIVAPGADPKIINLAFEGVGGMEIDAQGDLVLHTPSGDVKWQKPSVYQEGEAGKQAVAGGYVLRGQRRVGFELARYDSFKTLIIDPTVTYASYLGGSGTDVGNTIAVDSAGNAYIAGHTDSSPFPTTMGAVQTTLGGLPSDAFVSKIDATKSGALSLVYSTYLGGTSFDASYGIAVDSSGNAYVTGMTSSANFPVTAGALKTTFGGGQFRAFVTKVNPAGTSLVYSTFLGGNTDDRGYAIALDSAVPPSAYVTGRTISTDFPTTGTGRQLFLSGTQDAFVSKIDTTKTGTGSLVYSTYLGGSADAEGFGIAADSAGNAYVTGDTNSADFPTTPSAAQPAFGGFPLDAFVTKIDTTKSGAAGLVYSTYLGGNSNDLGLAIAADSVGNAYVTGLTNSDNFPVSSSPFQSVHSIPAADAFVTKIDTTKSGRASLIYSTFLGGGGIDRGFGIAIDTDGDAYVAGETGSLDFPMKNAIQSTFGGGDLDVFVTKFNPAGNALLFSTYLGGPGTDSGFAIALDTSRNVFMTGQTGSSGFTTPGGFQTTFGGGPFDAVIFKIAPSATDTQPDFALAVTAGTTTSLTRPAGQTATYHLQVVPLNGFTGTVSVSCVFGPSPPAVEATCSAPARASANAPTFDVTVSTTPRAFVPPMSPGLDLRRPWPLVAWIFGLLVIPGVWLAGRRLKPQLAAPMALTLLCLLTAESVGCGGHGGGGGGGAKGTPPGTYSLTVTGSTPAASRAINLSLTVN
jgi:hypothetical protein